MTVRIEGARPYRGPRTSDLTLRVHTDSTDAGRRTAHFYWKRKLAEPTIQWFIPWCSVDAAYPERHLREEIDFSGLVVDADLCPACTGADPE